MSDIYDPRPPWRQQFDAARDPYAARNTLGITTLGGGGAPTNAEYITSSANATLTNERVLTNTASITWDFSTAGQAKASTAAGGGNVSNSGTPTSGQYGKWVTATTIQGVAPATVLSDIGAAPLASPAFTGDPQAPTPAATDNDTSIATTAFVKSAVAFASNQTYYYDPTSTADVAGYKRLLLAPSPDAESTVPVSCSGTSDVLIGSFITDPGIPGAVEFPAGSAYRRLYGSVSAGVARFHLQIYKRTTGGVETLARDEFSQNFSNISVALIEYLATPSGATLDVTDRIVVKLYAQRVSGSATITVTFYAEGSSHASQTQTTIAVGNASVISVTPPLALSGGSLSIDLSGYQPIDADLTAIAALAGTNAIYYRSAANTWAAVTIGTGLSFSSGTLNRPALTGDVTASAGSNATTIANDAVIYAKMQNVSAAALLLGRGSAAGSGDPQEITLGTNLSMSGTTLNATAGGSAGGLLAIQVFSTAGSSTYTPTSGMVNAIIEVVGAGGGGGGTGDSTGIAYGASGGGSGAYSRAYKTAAQVGASQNVTVGAAGTGSAGVDGTAGGDSFVGANLAASLCGAKGGGGGGRITSGAGLIAPGAGGAAASGVGDLKAGGAPGGLGLYGSGTVYGGGGHGGSSFFGGGGVGPPATGLTAGTAGSAYGSGGSGASSYANVTGAKGGNGSAGVVIITEYK